MAETRRFPCPFFGADVELTGERATHIEEAHVPLLQKYEHLVAETIRDPDWVGDREGRPEQALIRHWPELLGGRSVVVVVVTDQQNETGNMRYWVVTSHIARAPRTWRPVWTRE